MLKLSNRDLTNFIIRYENTIENKMIANASSDIYIENVSPEKASEKTENMLANLFERLRHIQSIWTNLLKQN